MTSSRERRTDALIRLFMVLDDLNVSSIWEIYKVHDVLFKNVNRFLDSMEKNG